MAKYDQELTKELFLIEPIFIFLSAHVANQSFQKHCKENGVQYFYEKPLGRENLHSLLKLIADAYFDV